MKGRVPIFGKEFMSFFFFVSFLRVFKQTPGIELQLSKFNPILFLDLVDYCQIIVFSKY